MRFTFHPVRLESYYRNQFTRLVFPSILHDYKVKVFQADLASDTKVLKII
jgi:hypothetical protein